MYTLFSITILYKPLYVYKNIHLFAKTLLTSSGILPKMKTIQTR